MTAMRHKTDFVHIKRTRNIDEGSKAKNKNSKSVQHYSIGIFTELCLTQARSADLHVVSLTASIRTL